MKCPAGCLWTPTVARLRMHFVTLDMLVMLSSNLMESWTYLNFFFSFLALKGMLWENEEGAKRKRSVSVVRVCCLKLMRKIYFSINLYH